FTAARPPLPAGRYRAFADIVQESGVAQTLVASLEMPAVPPTPPEARGAAPGSHSEAADPDDSWTIAAAESEAGASATLADGSTMTWLRGGAPLAAGGEPPLRFAVAAPVGAAPLEPYLWMAGHAAVVRDDGLVFTHLHPMGTISLAAQAHFLER